MDVKKYFLLICLGFFLILLIYNISNRKIRKKMIVLDFYLCEQMWTGILKTCRKDNEIRNRNLLTIRECISKCKDPKKKKQLEALRRHIQLNDGLSEKEEQIEQLEKMLSVEKQRSWDLALKNVALKDFIRKKGEQV